MRAPQGRGAFDRSKLQAPSLARRKPIRSGPVLISAAVMAEGSGGHNTVRLEIELGQARRATRQRQGRQQRYHQARRRPTMRYSVARAINVVSTRPRPLTA